MSHPTKLDLYWGLSSYYDIWWPFLGQVYMALCFRMNMF